MKSVNISILLVFGLLVAITSCHSNKNPDIAEKHNTSESEKKMSPNEIHDFLKIGNKGVGPVHTFAHTRFDEQLADKGNKLFIVKCTICHEIKEDKIGPALYGVTKKRTPEWMLNMMLAPEKMLVEDPDARRLASSYDGVMTNMGLQPEEAIAVLEYLRQEDAK